MLSAVLELCARQPDAVEVRPHGEFFILGLVLLGTRRPLGQGLIVECQREDNVGANFTCV